MSDELFEVLEVFKKNSQDLELLKDEFSKISQDILEIKIENRINHELRIKVEQLSTDYETIKEQVTENSSLDGKINIATSELNEIRGEFRINEERLNDISQKSMYIENYIETINYFKLRYPDINIQPYLAKLKIGNNSNNILQK